MCFWLQPCRCPRATINLISVPEKGGESPVWCLPAWDYHPPHTPFPKPKSPSSHAWIVAAPAPPGSSFLHPAAPALLCSVRCLHSDPLTTEVRSCHAPAPALQASRCARDPIRPECGPQSPTLSGPGSFSFVSCHCPAPTPPLLLPRHVSVSDFVLAVSLAWKVLLPGLCIVLFPSSFRSLLTYHLIKRLLHLEQYPDMALFFLVAWSTAWYKIDLSI